MAAIAHRCQIRRGIEITAVRLAYDHGQGSAVLALEFIQKHAERALGLGDQPVLIQILDHSRQVIVVGALASDVGVGERHTQSCIDLLVVLDGRVDELLPQREDRLVPRLQANHDSSSFIGKVGLGEELRIGVEVERFQIRETFRLIVHPLHVRDQHAELCAPVPYVVLADHGVTEVLQHPRNRVADGGAAQMPDVHLLR